MADSIILATGQLEKSTIWTRDKDFEGLPGVKLPEDREPG